MQPILNKVRKFCHSFTSASSEETFSMSDCQNINPSTTCCTFPVSVMIPGSKTRKPTVFLLSGLNRLWNSADRWSQNGIARLPDLHLPGRPGAEMDVPRNVAKRVASLYLHCTPLLSPVSSLSFVPWFGRSYCTLDICLSPSFEAWRPWA